MTSEGSDAREEILERIRAALAKDPPGPKRPWSEAPRAAPPTDSLLEPEGREARFQEMLERVGGHFHRAADPAEVTAIVRRIALEAGVRRIVHSEVRVVQLRAESLSEEFACVPHDAPRDELLSCDLGLTSAQWGVAETGTIALESAAEHHRLASLLPPVHVAILDADRLLPTLDHLLAEVKAADPSDMSRTITMITGPSRTADIELTLVVGVHGPRHLHVILIDPQAESLP